MAQGDPSDGGRGRRLRWLLAAGLLAAGSLGYVARYAGHDAPGPAAAAREDAGNGAGMGELVASGRDAEASSARAVAARPATPRLVRSGDPDDLARYVTPGQPPPTMGEVIARLHDAGVHTGLGAFQPPGTSPPLVGLAVPEDFPLPPGYVRHYQATDDGQRIEPILMFSPDYEFFDAQGRPIAIPADRVVPPDLAPPGLALRAIALPPPRPSPEPAT
jgi:hypothetical protein